MAEILRSAGLKVICHNEHFSRDEDDHIWIPECARNGWVIITSDKGIETDPVNRYAVMQSNAAVFILADGSSRAANWAASVIVSRNRIYQAVRTHKPPFFMSIARDTNALVKSLRRPCPVPDSTPGDTMVIHASENDIQSEMEAFSEASSV